MRDVYIIGSHTTKFGKYLDNGIKELTDWTTQGVLDDAGIEKKEIQSAWFSNSGWGMREYQHCIRGQVALRPLGIDAIPITNVENACASGSTAFHGAWKDVASGLCDISLAIGVEKLHYLNKYAVFAGFIGGMDAGALLDMMEKAEDYALDPADIPEKPLPAVSRARNEKKPGSRPSPFRRFRDAFVVYMQLGEALGYKTVNQIARKSLSWGASREGKGDNGGARSPFMDVYAYLARQHMKKYGSTQRQLAAIAAKNHWHSTMNPNAQYRFDLSTEDVLQDRLVAYPLTRSMCAPIGDGAASAIVASKDLVDRLGANSRAIRVRASILCSGKERGDDEPDIGERAAARAYEQAGLGPKDIDLAEVHDATAFGELLQTEALGFFPKGEGGVHAEEGETKIGGSKPVNTSGGLLSRGHPIGASGLAQIHELVTHLRGEAGQRQVQGAGVAMAENGGGALGVEEAALCIHILSKS